VKKIAGPKPVLEPVTKARGGKLYLALENPQGRQVGSKELIFDPSLPSGGRIPRIKKYSYRDQKLFSGDRYFDLAAVSGFTGKWGNAS
jgi:hypothetical protein